MNYTHAIARLLPAWLGDRRPDPGHPHRRRYTAAYRRKLGYVRNIWIGAGLLMALFSGAAVISVTTLATTLLSFMVLDETA